MSAIIEPYKMPAPAEPKPEETQPKGFNLYKRSHFRDIVEPKGIDVLGKGIFRHGTGKQARFHMLLGQGGIGKSSFALAMAAAQIRGDSNFCGFPLNPDPRGWLFIGSENDAIRWKTDLDAVEKGLDESARERLESSLFVAGVFDEEDASLTLPDKQATIRATVEAFAVQSPGPLCVVMDPWSDLTADEVETGAVRAAIHSLRWIFADIPPRSGLSPAVSIITHAKPGKEHAANFTERFDGGGGMRGNRMPFNSLVRSAIALCPRDAEGTSLVLIVSKNNDGPGATPKGLEVDRDTLTYSVDPDFDSKQFREEQRAKSRGGAKAKVTTESVVKAVREGNRTTAGIVAYLAGVGGERSVKTALAAAIASGDLERTGRGEHILGPNQNPK